MNKLKQTVRTIILYVVTVVLVGGVPMAAFADTSQACIDAGHKGKKWATDTQTGQCIKLYNGKGEYIGPSYMTPQTPAPQDDTEGAATTVQDSTASPTTTVNDSGSSNSTAADSTTAGTSDTTVTNGVDVTNTIGSTAQSGNATVKGNESSGSATSGDTSTQATVVNSVHSTTGGSTGVATFTYDINGNVVGDITLSGNSGPVDVNNKTTVNNATNIDNDTSLTNNVDLQSTSGNATVKGNESSGSATSGSANTVANILNLINTIIAANQSFIGTINIYGNLNGDILLSPELIPQLIAANNGTVTATTDLALSTNINDDTNIVNNVKLTAASGSATVNGNQSSGSAASGNTQTNLTILNLTGHTVNAANSLLVFVNVLGTWVGMIVDAPGATAAALGTGIISDTTNLTDTTTINNNSRITNNIDLSAQSGDALVGGNRSSGDATSGDASASANIANISTSVFNLSGWFGVLYINVFGQWLGSFGIDTAAGTITPVGGMAVDQPSGSIASPGLHFGFNPSTSSGKQFSSLALGSGSGSNAATGTGAAALLASTQTLGASTAKLQPTLVPVAGPQSDPFSVVMMIAGFSVAGVSAAWMLVRRRMEMQAATSL